MKSTTSTRLQIHQSVAKTAQDAFDAKLSAVQSNFQLVPSLILKETSSGSHKAILCYNRDDHDEDENCQFINGQNVYKDLLFKFSQGRIKRQTPLVNAGYAVRVSAISSTILRFLLQHFPTPDEDLLAVQPSSSSSRDSYANVVFLGAGMDVLGLWTSFMSFNFHPWNRVQIYEIDCIDTVKAKRDVIIKSNILSSLEENVVDADVNDKSLNILRGNIRPIVSGRDISRKKGGDWDYTLMAADLRDTETIHSALQGADLDATKPTIVISELVLAYLQNSSGNGDDIGHGSSAKRGQYIESLLTYISSHLCITRNSLFLAYEPVIPGRRWGSGGTDLDHDDDSCISVLQGYSCSYFSKFASKLDKGSIHHNNRNKSSKSSSSNENDKDNTIVNESNHSTVLPTTSKSFGPIGKSCAHVVATLREQGFDGIASSVPIVNILPFMNDTLQTIGNDPQLFDEHAALYLHLHCYSIICATGKNMMVESSLSLDVKKWLSICPWLKHNLDASTRNSFSKYTSGLRLGDAENLNFIVSAIKVEHQEQVRRLFKSSYEHLFDSYPSVKKLVKSALKNDLCMKPSQTTMGKDGAKCPIWDHYSREGGAFWVVLESTPYCDGEGGYEEGYDTSLKNVYRIIGCIGIKKRSRKHDLSNRKKYASYEINRFAVDSSFRRRGIGRELLKRVEDFVRGKEPDDVMLEVIANTPTVLEISNQFYSTNGFRVEQETRLGQGQLIIRTFSKTI